MRHAWVTLLLLIASEHWLSVREYLVILYIMLSGGLRNEWSTWSVKFCNFCQRLEIELSVLVARALRELRAGFRSRGPGIGWHTY